jgi:hypothetical protein
MPRLLEAQSVLRDELDGVVVRRLRQREVGAAIQRTPGDREPELQDGDHRRDDEG